MELDRLLTLAREALGLVLLVSAPAVLVSLAVGLAIGLLQAATQIQEFSLSFVPKILAVLAVLLVAAPWMGELLLAFARAAWGGGA
ncbi:MAG TPA: flagellar biosynthesis protein FliQ [Myxococcota bacterium]|nr:flagellar biosynthesis protein FliQ [Myxococcota bacterium]HRY92521.1 flagellar biosynthesis protein FliQ [Myxococcota bacterium]HSA24214.1 flagellar biosynthesis protein FliQ [Myxococcota bacterium]